MKTIKDLLGTPESIRLDGRKKEFREKLKKLAYEKAKKEAEAPIDEISKDLAGKYIKKRADDMPHAGYMMNDPHSSERRKKGVRDYVKMQKGVKTAVNKLTGKAMVPATEATAKVDSFLGHKHAKRAGINVKVHGSSMMGGDDVTLSHPDKKKLQKYVDNHAGGAEQGVHVKEKTEAYMSGHGHGSGVVYGGKHDDPAFQALMKKHGVTHKLIGKSGKAAKLIGSPDNIRKVLQSEDKTTDAERAAIDAFMKKKGAKQLPPGKAQGHTGKSFSIKPMGISPDKMGVTSPKRLDRDMVHKEDKAYGPTGIAYSVPKGHPDAVDPKTGKKKNAKEDTVASVAKDLEKATKKDKKESFKSFMKNKKGTY